MNSDQAARLRDWADAYVAGTLHSAERETLERELKARESRLKQEKELVDKECEWVKTELQRRDDQLRTIRSEQVIEVY